MKRERERERERKVSEETYLYSGTIERGNVGMKSFVVIIVIVIIVVIESAVIFVIINIRTFTVLGQSSVF